MLALRYISRGDSVILTARAKRFWEEVAPIGEHAEEVGKHLFALCATVAQEANPKSESAEDDFLSKGE